MKEIDPRDFKPFAEIIEHLAECSLRELEEIKDGWLKRAEEMGISKRIADMCIEITDYVILWKKGPQRCCWRR